MIYYWWPLLVFIASLKGICCERISDQIYLDLIGGRYSCFRLLNGTHEVGCGSAEEGNEGVVIYADSADKLVDAITNHDFANAIITAFDKCRSKQNCRRTIQALKDDSVRGILLFYNGSASSELGFSEDAFCPNEQFGLYDKCEKRWNERGALLPDGFRFVNWRKPIFIIENKTETEIIKHSCYEAFNSGNLKRAVLCSARMKHFMRAAGNAEICLRRQELFYGFSDTTTSLCDPLEEKNLFATVPAFVKDFRPKILIISARMDSFSSFTEAAVGEVSVLTSLVSLLAVTKVIGNYSSEFEAAALENKRAIIFAFFHGESLGYIGSSATVNDIRRGEFPLNIQLVDIDSFIEVQQLDGSKSGFSAHIDSKSYHALGNREKVGILLSAANLALKQNHTRSSETTGESVVIEDITQIPPSSYQSFLKKRRGIAGFVLRPFDQQYTYNRINSLEDQNVFENDIAELEKQVVAAATAVLGAVAGFLTDGNGTEIELISRYHIDEQYVAVLLDCFLNYPDWHSCDFFKNITKGDNRFEHLPKETYISAGRNSYSLIRILVNALIVNTLGSKNAVNVPDRSQCEDLNKHQKVYHYTWQYDPEDEKFACYRNSLYTTVAESPAFGMDEYNMQSGMYSTWVESVWATKQFKLFLTKHPYPMHVTILLSGLIVFIVSFFAMELIYLGNREALEPSASALELDYNAAPL